MPGSNADIHVVRLVSVVESTAFEGSNGDGGIGAEGNRGGCGRWQRKCDRRRRRPQQVSLLLVQYAARRGSDATLAADCGYKSAKISFLSSL